MTKLLYIKASPKPSTESRTFRISDSFVDAYQKSHPNDEITVLDLYKEEIGFLSYDDVVNHDVTPGYGKDHPVLKYAYQFLETDKIVISAPFWNLAFPAILKAYLDYVTVSGITFMYTSNGPTGQCQGKKAIHFVTRGGEYSKEPLSSYELGDRYLRTLFGFLGITDFTTFALENMDRRATVIEEVIANAIKEASELAKTF